MPYLLGEPFVQTFNDTNGDPVSGGSVEFYITGTTTPTNIYSDDSGTSQGTSVNLNARGAPESSGGTPIALYFDTAVDYKLIVKDASGTQIPPTIDPYTSRKEISYSTVAEMKASSLTAGEIVTTAGYTTAGDGGNGTYLIAASASVDGYGDHTLANGNIALLQSNGRFLSVQYGVVMDGTTDDTAAIQALIAAADRSVVEFVPNGTDVCIVDPITITGSATSPAGIDFKSVVLKAKTASQSHVLKCENPHYSTASPVRFFIRRLIVDGDNKAILGFHLHGSQYCDFQVRAVNCTQKGVYREGEAGYGIFYNTFELQMEYNGSRGVDDCGMASITSDNTYRIAANWVRVTSSLNKGHGLISSYDQDDYSATVEANDFTGWRIGNTRSISVLGGYSESNSQNIATDGTSDGSDDESFELLSGSPGATGVKIIGGRHIGAVIGANQYGNGNYYNSTNVASYHVPNHTYKGTLTVDGNLTASDILLGHTSNQLGVSVGATSTVTLETGANLGTDRTFFGILQDAGSTRADTAVIRITTGGTITVASMGQTDATLFFTTDGTDLQCENTSGSARTAEFNLIRVL